MRILLRTASLAGLALAVTGTVTHAKRIDRDTLLQVVTPRNRGEAPAHPFVNVIVRFGTSSDRFPADPTTFRARIGNRDVTSQFVDEITAGVVVGKRGRLESPDLQPGRRARLLRLSIRSEPRDSGKKRRRTYRDADTVRFRAVEAANQPPTAQAARSSDIILPSIPIQFDATRSQDPEDDALQYLWDFGDGTTSTEPKPSHAYGDGAGEGERTVRLTVSDGQATSDPVEFSMLTQPACDASALPGLLKVEADAALEFGVVPVGNSATRTITIRNVDVMPGTQVRATLGTDSNAFTVDPRDVVLGPGESMPVTITFTGAAGHQAARIGVVACTANQNSVAFLARGYGGDAQGTGPTLAADTVYYSGLAPGIPRFGIFGIRPDGARFQVDNSANWCVKPNGTGTRDLCFVTADCRADGEQCVSTAPLNIAFDPSDFCSDSLGNVFILSEDTVLDPVGDDNEVTGSVVRIRLDAAGNRVGQDVVRRITGTTNQLACDDVAGGDGGLLFMPEYRAIALPGNCIRDAQEALTGIRKAGGALVDFGINRIDALEVPPKLECDDDYDPVVDLAVTANGNQVYFIPEEGGVYRLRPNPLYIVQAPVGGNTLFNLERIQVHPDGAVLYAAATDTGTTGNILLFKIFPEQAENGALRLEDLTPCATFAVPNNGGRTVLFSFGADQRAVQADQITALVSFGSGSTGTALAPRLRPAGTVSFSSPTGSTTCSVNGLVNLELLDGLTF
jgi:PKD domain/Abnormal spindle-like microcephaly-assoc'd, ASPM-SPD-2-Hydin